VRAQQVTSSIKSCFMKSSAIRVTRHRLNDRHDKSSGEIVSNTKINTGKLEQYKEIHCHYICQSLISIFSFAELTSLKNV
jgi:hypothetical protein